jgi:tetratricopeptide (TPR) repeat protein
MNNLGEVYVDRGQLTEGEPLLAGALDGRRRVLGAEHPETLTSLHNLAWLRDKQKRHDESVATYLQVIELRRRVLGADHPHTLLSMENLAIVYQALGQYAKAEPIFRERIATLRKCHGDASPMVGDALAVLGYHLLGQNKYGDAEPVLRECLAIREKQQPDIWSTFNTKSRLGSALLGQKKYADAEPLLLAGYEGMKQREKLIPPRYQARVTEALEPLVQLYGASGPKEKADEWRKKLEEAKASAKVRSEPK